MARPARAPFAEKRLEEFQVGVVCAFLLQLITAIEISTKVVPYYVFRINQVSSAAAQNPKKHPHGPS